MDALVPLWLAAKFVLLLAGLIAPGAFLLRALRLPPGVGAIFAGSAVTLYVTVLGLQLTGLPISLLSLTVGLTAITLGLRWAGRRRPASIPGDTPGGSQGVAGDSTPAFRDWSAPFANLGKWMPLYLLFWGAAVLRAWHEPLAGPDIEFRWGFLAETILRTGGLDFYPPQSAADFATYFWAESIPPGVAALHAWAFACAGGTEWSWTIPATLLQLLALHELLWRTAAAAASTNAARYTCLAAAACPLLTWSFHLGQETGLTTLALVGMAFALLRWLQTGTAQQAALLGIFAVLGASAREYGLIFPLLGVAGLLAFQGDRKSWCAYLGVAGLALWWPLRVALLTGNPFYSLELGGLPVNSRFLAWIDHDAAALGGVLPSSEGWKDAAQYLVRFAPAALIGLAGLAPALFRRNPWRRETVAIVVAAAGFAALWGISVRYTQGGIFYSLRVASPALALGALVFGVQLAFVGRTKPKLTHRLTLALGVLSVAAIPAVLALPRNPWRTPPPQWPAFASRSAPADGPEDPTIALLLSGGNPGVVLADAPGFQRRGAAAGVTVVPLWSPQADGLFDVRLSPEEAARAWQESGIRRLVISKYQRNLDFFNEHSRWAQPPFIARPEGETADTWVFAIEIRN
jgi:hypothetical protein